MPMFPELVAPIQSRLNIAEADLERLRIALKEKKLDIRGLKKMLREANGVSAQRKVRMNQEAKS